MKLFIENREAFYIIDESDIVFIKQDKRQYTAYTTVYADITTWGKVSELYLPSLYMVRCGLLININEIYKILPDKIIFKNDLSVSIGRDARYRLIKFIKEQNNDKTNTNN